MSRKAIFILLLILGRILAEFQGVRFTAPLEEEKKEEELAERVLDFLLLTWLRRKLVDPETPADAGLIILFMLSMILLMSIVWYSFIFLFLTVIEIIREKIAAYRESHAREFDVREFRRAYVEHERQNPDSVVVRRGGRRRQRKNTTVQ